jgi:N-acetylmuramoyl-L-alanine amidase
MRTYSLLLLLPALVLASEAAAPLPEVVTAATPRPQASADLSDGKRVVAIDVGHSKRAPGAISATGIPEYQFNLKMAERVRAAFAESKNVRPFIITSPKEMSLAERSRLAAAQNADLFISIHHDSAQDKYLKIREVDGKERRYTDKFSGYSIFVSRKNPRYEESFDIARGIGRAMAASGFKFATHHAEEVQGENRPIIDKAAGIYAFDDLVVLKTAIMPAVLVECGVILNPEEEESLLTAERQVKTAAAIVRGVTDYFAHAPLSPANSPKVPIEKSEPTPRKYPKPGTPLEFEPVRSSERPKGEHKY